MAEYEELRAREEADQQELNARFSGERDVSSWLDVFRLVIVIQFLVDATLFKEIYLISTFSHEGVNVRTVHWST